jgi:putative ABC transport system permease protein
MLASVAERTREIGILRAVGFRQWHVMRIVLLEVAVTSLVGGALGWALGTIAAFGLGRAVADLETAVLPDGTMAASALGLALLLGVSAGVYPALRAARMDPTQAFREF